MLTVLGQIKARPTSIKHLLLCVCISYLSIVVFQKRATSICLHPFTLNVSLDV